MTKEACVAQSVKRLSSVWVMSQGSWDEVLHHAPCSHTGKLLPLPAAPCICAPFLVSLKNKLNQIKLKKNN